MSGDGEKVDAPVLGTGAERHGGSNPPPRTDESEWATARAKAIVEEELRLYGFPDGTDCLRRIVRDALIGGPDNPELDCTDFAHPAYWRGEHDGVLGAIRVLRHALEHGDTGGVCGNAELERLKQDICKLRKP